MIKISKVDDDENIEKLQESELKQEEYLEEEEEEEFGEEEEEEEINNSSTIIDYNTFKKYPCDNYFQLFMAAFDRQQLDDWSGFEIEPEYYRQQLLDWSGFEIESEYYNTIEFKRINEIFSNQASDPPKFVEILKKNQHSIPNILLAAFFNLDDDEDNKRRKITKILENEKNSCTGAPKIIYSRGISSNLDFPFEVLRKKHVHLEEYQLSFISRLRKWKNEDCQKKFDQEFSEECNCIYKILFILGSKNDVPVLLMFNQKTKLRYFGTKVSQNKIQVFKSKEKFLDSIDTIYLLFYKMNKLFLKKEENSF